MNIVDQVKQAIAAKEKERAGQVVTSPLTKTLGALAERGLLVRKPYSLPPLDTVGFGATAGENVTERGDGALR